MRRMSWNGWKAFKDHLVSTLNDDAIKSVIEVAVPMIGTGVAIAQGKTSTKDLDEVVSETVSPERIVGLLKGVADLSRAIDECTELIVADCVDGDEWKTASAAEVLDLRNRAVELTDFPALFGREKNLPAVLAEILFPMAPKTDASQTASNDGGSDGSTHSQQLTDGPVTR